MIIGRVSGNVQSTVKLDYYQGLPLKIIEPINLPSGEKKGRDFIAVDKIGAGVGELVLLTNEGGCAAEVIGRGSRKPVDSVIVAIIDEIVLEN